MAAGGGGSGGIKQPISLNGDEEVRRAFERIGESGTKALGDINKAAQAGSKEINKFGKAVGGVVSPFGKLKAGVADAHKELGVLHEKASAFGSSLANIAGNVIPNFNTLLAAGTIGGAAGFLALVTSTAKWGHRLEENSARLGIMPTELLAIAKAARQAGIDTDHVTNALTKFSISMEAAHEKRGKDISDIAEEALGSQAVGAQVLRGGRGAAAANAVIRGSTKAVAGAAKLQGKLLNLGASRASIKV